MGVRKHTSAGADGAADGGRIDCGLHVLLCPFSIGVGSGAMLTLPHQTVADSTTLPSRLRERCRNAPATRTAALEAQINTYANHRLHWVQGGPDHAQTTMANAGRRPVCSGRGVHAA